MFRPIKLQTNGIIMAVIGTEDIAFWEKVYNVFPPKNLDSLFVVENFSKRRC